jgi:hypothetical protein
LEKQERIKQEKLQAAKPVYQVKKKQDSDNIDNDNELDQTENVENEN